jgi:cytoskeletal protein CcmA (bactofilin family)
MRGLLVDVGALTAALPRLLVALALLTAPAAAPADDDDDDDAGNVYLAAGVARTPGPVAGDFFAAGGRISIDHEVGGEAMVAGGSVRVGAPVREDLFAVGGSVEIASSIGDDASVAAGDITISKDGRIDGRAWLAGGSVEIDGELARGARIFADRVRISGRIAGTLRIVADRIEILPGARLDSLRYTSRSEPRIASDAEIAGPIVRVPQLKPEQQSAPRPSREWVAPVVHAGLWAAGILMLLAFPRFTVAAQDRLRASPWPSLALGAALVFTVPIAAVVLAVTVVGIPVALALLALYGVLLLAGLLTALFFVAERMGRILRRGREPSIIWRIGLLFAALVLVALAGRLPFAGCVLLCLGLLFGVGALALELYHRYADRRAPA